MDMWDGTEVFMPGSLPTLAQAGGGGGGADAAGRELTGQTAAGGTAATGAPGGAATGAPGSAPAAGGGAQQSPLFGPSFLLIIGGLFVFMILTQMMGGRKEKKKRAEMLAGIKRHDKVQTVGGIIGTVAEVRDDELVLRVDESSNTKIRFARSAVQQVLRASGETEVEPKPSQETAKV